MKKPRIIIADTDASYTIPIQLKFVEEFFDRIDLEIITDEKYFDQLFSAAQSLDVLIIAENLYNDGLQKHSIGQIFIMQEMLDDVENTAALNVTRIAKYSSIKEIFNEIVGKSGISTGTESNIKQEPQIVLVTSGSGGAGKTTVALGLSAALTNNYKRVLYLNADRLQTFQSKLTNPLPITANDIYTRLLAGSKNLFSDVHHAIRTEGFQYLPPFKAALMSLGLKYSIFEQIASAAKASKNYDFVIIDADSALDEWKTRLIDIADKIIIVTGQSRASVYATNCLFENISGASGEKFIYICNNFDRDEENALTDPGLRLKFSVNEYIQHIPKYDQKSIEALAKEKDIQKLAFLLI